MDNRDIAKLDIGRKIRLRQVVDPQGEVKGPHAAIVRTSKQEIQAGKPILAAVISSQLRGLQPEQIVPLRHGKPGMPHPSTGLDRPSAVIGHWVVEVHPGDITNVDNLIWGPELPQVIACTNRAKQALDQKRAQESSEEPTQS